MIAKQRVAPDRYERAVEAIHALMTELGLGRHALFDEVGEGMMFPDGTESMSGSVIDETGRIFMFWTDRDAARGRPVFTTWEEIDPASLWSEGGEYLEARADVGLS